MFDCLDEYTVLVGSSSFIKHVTLISKKKIFSVGYLLDSLEKGQYISHYSICHMDQDPNYKVEGERIEQMVKHPRKFSRIRCPRTSTTQQSGGRQMKSWCQSEMQKIQGHKDRPSSSAEWLMGVGPLHFFDRNDGGCHFETEIALIMSEATSCCTILS